MHPLRESKAPQGIINDIFRATQELEGILKGIGADGIINVEELKSLKGWLELHDNMSGYYPFAELREITSQAVANGEIDPEVQVEILECCRDFVTKGGVVDQMTRDVRVLHGFVQGIIADGVIKLREAEDLREWLTENVDRDIREKVWPFNEICLMLDEVLADGRISGGEHQWLMDFFQSFRQIAGDPEAFDETISPGPWMVTDAPVLRSFTSICDYNVEVQVPERVFCFTGQMRCGKRAAITKRVEAVGGRASKNVIRDLDFLVIGADSSPCWAYSTYGRKIEKAMKYKTSNQCPISIIHENHFLPALLLAEQRGGTKNNQTTLSYKLDCSEIICTNPKEI